jgi:hypothetical protein
VPSRPLSVVKLLLDVLRDVLFSTVRSVQYVGLRGPPTFSMVNLDIASWAIAHCQLCRR